MSRPKGEKRQFQVGHKPLGFFHFSGYDVQDRLNISKHDGRHDIFNFPAVAEILNWYSDQILASPLSGLLKEPYRYDQLANGSHLTPFIRQLLKKYEMARTKVLLRKFGRRRCLVRFPDGSPAGNRLSAASRPAEIYDRRPDLQRQWPGACTAVEAEGFWWWFCHHAGDEYSIQFLIDYYRRALVSDSSLDSRSKSPRLVGKNLQFLGKERTLAARKLRAAGENDLAQRFSKLAQNGPTSANCRQLL